MLQISEQLMQIPRCRRISGECVK